MSRISVGIADDHSVFVESLSNTLNNVSGIVVIHTSNSGIELLNNCEMNKVPDVILLDLSMPDMDGFETCQELVQRFPEVKVIALTGHKEKNYIAKMIRSGASGYLLKTAKVDDVANAVKKAADGGLPFNNEAIEVMCNIYKDNDGVIAKKTDFSERELQIIQLTCQEFSTKEISKELYLSESTVSSHKKNIFAKMKVKNTIGLAIYAFTHGLIN